MFDISRERTVMLKSPSHEKLLHVCEELVLSVDNFGRDVRCP